MTEIPNPGPHDDGEDDSDEGPEVEGFGTGAGAGKVTFNPFSITRKIDVASPKLFSARSLPGASGPGVEALLNPTEG